MTSSLVRSLVPLALVFASACSDGATGPAGRVYSVSIGEQTPSITAPQRIPLPGPFTVHVDADPGVSTKVHWSSSDPTALAIDGDSVAYACKPTAFVALTAIAVEDPTKSGSLATAVSQGFPPGLSISSITDVATGQLVDINAVRGKVRIGLNVNAATSFCYGVARFDAEAITESGIIPIVSREFQPAARSWPIASVIWNSSDVPAGTVFLQVRATLADGGWPVMESTRPVVVRK